MVENHLTENSVKTGNPLKKSFIMTIVVLFIAIVTFSAQTYAYFVDSTTVEDNKILAGSLGVELIQVQDGAQVDHTVAPVQIFPGTEMRRNVSVKNTGTLPVYVRIKIEKSILESENEMPRRGSRLE